MIDESLINVHTGTTFSVSKKQYTINTNGDTQDVSILSFVGGGGYENYKPHFVAWFNDCDGCNVNTCFNDLTYGDVLVVGLGLGCIPEYIRQEKSFTRCSKFKRQSIKIMSNLTELIYLASSVFLILAIYGLSSPKTANRGNTFGMVGIAMAIGNTMFFYPEISNRMLIILAIVIGGIMVLDHAGLVNSPNESKIVRKYIGNHKIEQLKISGHPSAYVVKKNRKEI